MQLLSKLFSILTWLSKVAQWIVTHHPTIVSQEVTCLVWLVQQFHLLLQSHVLVWEGEIPETERGKHSDPPTHHEPHIPVTWT